MDSFIDTAILADQTVQNAARMRNTTLKALAQKAWWRISQTMPPDFRLELDLETATKPLLNIYTGYDSHGFPTKRIQVPAIRPTRTRSPSWSSTCAWTGP